MKINQLGVMSSRNFGDSLEKTSFRAEISVEFDSVEDALAFSDACRKLLHIDARIAPITDPVESAKVAAPRAQKVAEPEPEPEVKPPKAKAAKKADPEPEPDDEEASEDDDEDGDVEVIEKPSVKLTKELKNASKLRDVLRILIEVHGITSKKALVKECKALQPHVPVLERIEDLEGRVPKAAEIVDPQIKP